MRTYISYYENVSQSGGTHAVSGPEIWLSDQYTEGGYAFPTGAWSGQITLVDALQDGESFTIEIGSSSNGVDFVPAGSDTVNFNPSTPDLRVFPISMSGVALYVPEDQYLALRINPGTIDPFSVRIGSAYSYITAPPQIPEYPLPEIASGLLVGLGLIALGITIWLKKRKKVIV